jgi:hypothetical protein
MAQMAAQLVDHVIPHVPVRQWVLSLPIPLRPLLAAQPKLVTPVLQMVHRVITRHLMGQAGLKPDEADSGAVTLIQRFRLTANLSVHLHCQVLDGVHRRSAEGAPVLVEACAPTDEALQSVLHKIITRRMKLLARRGVLVEEEGSITMADNDGDSDAARVLRAAAGRNLYLSHCLRPARWLEGADDAGRVAEGERTYAIAVGQHRRVEPVRRRALRR